LDECADRVGAPAHLRKPGGALLSRCRPRARRVIERSRASFPNQRSPENIPGDEGPGGARKAFVVDCALRHPGRLVRVLSPVPALTCPRRGVVARFVPPALRVRSLLTMRRSGSVVIAALATLHPVRPAGEAPAPVVEPSRRTVASPTSWRRMTGAAPHQVRLTTTRTGRGHQLTAAVRMPNAVRRVVALYSLTVSSPVTALPSGPRREHNGLCGGAFPRVPRTP